MKNFRETLGSYFSFLLFNATNCSEFYAALSLNELGHDVYDRNRNFLNLTFQFVKDGLCRVRLHEQTNITDFLKPEELD